MNELSDKISRLEKQFDKFRVVGGSNVTVEGSIRKGFAICVTCPEATPTTTPVIPTGACCFPDGTCTVTTSNTCSIMGGTYQGDDTVCDPNPCPQPVGCHGITMCTVDFSFAYQDQPDPPIGHAFSGTGSVNFDVSDCSGFASDTVFVTVVVHGQFGDSTCVPDAAVTIQGSATYDPMAMLWNVGASVDMLDHATVCDAEGWPSNTILSDTGGTLSDAGGTLPLVPETVPNMTGTVTFSFS